MRTKGSTKPLKHQLDVHFNERLRDAMRFAGYTAGHNRELDVTRLAARVKCSRMVIHNYLKAGKSKASNAVLLFEIADALDVSARWLITGKGDMRREQALTPEQSALLNLHSLMSEAARAAWLTQGENLRALQPNLVPTTGDPYGSTRHTLHEPPAKGR